VHRIDDSQALVPTSYMVLDWLPGEEARYLAHPDNPDTTSADKREVLRLLGDAYAQMHAITRPAGRPDATTDALLYRLEQLQHVTEDGQLDVDLDAIHRAQEVVRRDPDLRVECQSLCMGDAELHLVREGGDWRVSFLCDVEWVDYGDASLDLANLVPLPRQMWEFDAPVHASERKLAAQPWVAGYAARRPLDLAKLARRALYAHLNVMCSITDQVYRPEKRPFMVARTPLYRALVEAVVALEAG